mgnify:CR=1 FL=1
MKFREFFDGLVDVQMERDGHSVLRSGEQRGNREHR